MGSKVGAIYKSNVHQDDLERYVCRKKKKPVPEQFYTFCKIPKILDPDIHNSLRKRLGS